MPATITVLDSTGATQTVSTLDKITAQLPAALGSAAAAASSPVTIATDDGIQAKLGIVTETAPATDTASSGLNGRLQRIAQRISSLIALLPTALGAGGGLKVDGSGTALPISGAVSVSNLPGTQPVSGTFWQATQPISAAALPLPTGAALDASIGTTNTEIGGLTETAPASDTASSGLNGRLQRIAQRISSLIALLPTSLGAGGGLKVDGSGTALPVSGTVAVSGTVPVSGSFYQATQPISAASLPLPAGAALETGGNLATVATAQGNAATGITIPTGGAGILGWLSGIFNKLNTSIAVTGTFWQATQPVSGSVALSGTSAVSVADGSDLATGATTDAAASAGGTGSLSAKLRRISSQLVAALGQGVSAASMSVVLASDQMSTTPWATSSRLPTSELDELAVSGTLTSAAVLFTQDMAGYESISVQVTSAGTTCTITYETSDDNTNWVSCSGILSAAISSSAAAFNSTTAVLNRFPKNGRYFRARVATYTSGTVTVVGNCHKSPVALSTSVQLAGSSTVVGGNAQGGSLASAIQTNIAAYSANPAAVSNATCARPIGTIIGAQIVRPYSIPEADWQNQQSLTDGTSKQVVAAGAAGVKNYCTAIQVSGITATTAVTLSILSGASVIWTGNIPAGASQQNITFPTPLQTAAATALNAQLSGSPTGAVAFNAQGYAAAD